MHRCRGFGIQSPTDYAFVRYVINEHWPYYAYATFPDTDSLTRKLGEFYFRLANWYQPHNMKADSYQVYFQAGCKKTVFVSDLSHVELARTDIENHEECRQLIELSDAKSVLVIERIYRNWSYWHQIVHDDRVGTTFDLYYCGIVLFDTNRYKHHYKINF